MPIVNVNTVDLYVEGTGDPARPPILLIHGAGHSLLTWEDEFVERLAAGGRYVVRYDARDAGLSASYPVGEPGYGLRDLVADAAALIETLGAEAHVVGMSQGAAVAQLLALDHPDLVASLTAASSTPGIPGSEAHDLPPMPEGLDVAEEPDWSDDAAVVEYLVEVERPYAGRFDEEAMRTMARRVVGRTRDVAAQLSNPFMIEPGEPWRARLGSIDVPTLVVHGTDDPLFPIEHGRALAAEIPGAGFLPLEHTGHEVFPRAHWDLVIPAILDHTARG